MAAAAIIGAGISIYGAVDAKSKEKKAKSELDAWNKSHPQDFRTAKEIQQEAELSTPSGFSPAEKAAFQQNMTRRSNASRRMATDRNPNLSGAVNAAINYGNIQGLVNFSAQDAQLRRQMIAQKTGLIQGQSNAQTRYNQQVAGQYGQAIQQQAENFTNSLYNVANSAAAYGYYSGGSGAKTGAGGAKTTPATTTAMAQPNSVNPVGSDMWAANLYGNPAAPPPQPAFYGQAPSQRLGTGVPSKNATPYQTTWDTNQFFSNPY